MLCLSSGNLEYFDFGIVQFFEAAPLTVFNINQVIWGTINMPNNYVFFRGLATNERR